MLDRDLLQHVISQGLIAEISGATLWRWLSSDALRPWKHRSWIFPRDPNFAAKAGPILDLYQRVWEGAPLGAVDYVICGEDSPLATGLPATPATQMQPEDHLRALDRKVFERSQYRLWREREMDWHPGQTAEF